MIFPSLVSGLFDFVRMVAFGLSGLHSGFNRRFSVCEFSTRPPFLFCLVFMLICSSFRSSASVLFQSPSPVLSFVLCPVIARKVFPADSCSSLSLCAIMFYFRSPATVSSCSLRSSFQFLIRLPPPLSLIECHRICP